MNNAFQQFQQNIRSCNELMALYDHLVFHLLLPNDLSDLLRSQFVNSISALDRLIHEFIRIGAVQTFVGTRPRTPKFESFSISLNTYFNCLNNPFPSTEYWFEQEVILRNKHLSFQDPEKISEGLSLIWIETHKWAVISNRMGINERTLKTRLKTIVSRRNQIVHEADINPVTNTLSPIDRSEVQDTVTFIHSLGSAIYQSVI